MAFEEWTLPCIEENTSAFSLEDEFEISEYLKEEKTINELTEHNKCLISAFIVEVLPELTKNKITTHTEWKNTRELPPEEISKFIFDKIKKLTNIKTTPELESLKLRLASERLKNQQTKEGNDVFEASNNVIVNEDGFIIKTGNGGPLAKVFKEIFKPGESIYSIGINWEDKDFIDAKEKCKNKPGEQIQVKWGLKAGKLFFNIRMSYLKNTGNFAIYIEDATELHTKSFENEKYAKALEEQNHVLAKLAEFMLNNPNPVFRVTLDGIYLAEEYDSNFAFREKVINFEKGTDMYDIFSKFNKNIIDGLKPGENIIIEQPILMKTYKKDQNNETEEIIEERICSCDIKKCKDGGDSIFIFPNDITDRKRLEEQLKSQSITDALTEIPNRRAFEMRIDTEIKRSNRQGNNLALIMVDIDYFKNVNDTYGHSGGDETLKSVAQMIQNKIRCADFVARFGGEEFVILLPDTDLNGAISTAENIRKIIESFKIKLADSKETSVTISLGVAERKGKESAEDILRKADTALYNAKENGRNRVVVNEENEFRTIFMADKLN